jgi:hypothetical protein
MVKQLKVCDCVASSKRTKVQVVDQMKWDALGESWGGRWPSEGCRLPCGRGTWVVTKPLD